MNKPPEHFDFSSPLYLPLSEATCKRLAEGTQPLAELGQAQLAALLVIQNLAQGVNTSAAAETVLKRLLAWSLQPSTGATLHSEAQRLFDPLKFARGLHARHKAGVRLLTEEQVAQADYLLASGEWDDTFRARHHAQHASYDKPVVTPRRQEVWLSSAQDMVLRTFCTNKNEHLHIQGYAGIGKTHLITSMLQFLDPGKTMILVKTRDKVNELKARIPYNSRILTFEDFALRLIGTRLQRTAVQRRFSLKPVKDTVIAERLSILPMRDMDAAQVVALCMKAVDAYCDSADYKVRASHLPFFPTPLGNLEQSVLLEYANRLWRATDPAATADFELPFRGMLVVKKAALMRLSMPPSYTHVIIDESHDLPPSLLQVLEANPQALITLGDEYQRLHGWAANRSRDVRQKEATFSVRSGVKIEQVLNPLIQAHPSKLKLPFEAARDVALAIERYDGLYVPDKPVTVLVSSIWEMFQWFRVLTDAGRGINFMGKAAEHFETFATDAIRLHLYQQHSQHDALYQFADWQALTQVQGEHEPFQWITRRLEEKYHVSSVTEALHKARQYSEHNVTLALVTDVGNMEFERVLVAPQLMPFTLPRDPYELDLRISSLYTAASRARHALYLPADIEEWLGFYRQHGYALNQRRGGR